MNGLRLKMRAAIALLAIGLFFCASAQAAISVKQSWLRVSAVAGETLATGDVVTIADADGLAYKADANGVNLTPAIGIIGKGGTAGHAVEIIVAGILSGWSNLSEGQNGYLSETAGAITQSSPAYSQKLGVAISTTDYFFNCQNQFDSSAVTALGVLAGATPIVLEGATADAFETTLAVTDPTADRTITIPDKAVTLASSVLVVTADANGKTVAAAEAGDINTMGGAGVWDLPEASTCIGCVFDFAVTAAGNADINPADGDLILGLTNAPGDAIRCATAGSSIRLVILDATNIAAMGPSCIGGAWADAN